ncbi:Atu2307/SP_0267 family LLM class monooxygenase [Geofilum sp. OHC36d9]|uniref:Atu2307/SP_0267 family LLM class monooxygenase n=1 Tax=Geofilum sp. OHC36d9 TaxID=3458413 RepID=UPI0040345188
MELGIDSFAAVNVKNEVERPAASMVEMDRLLTRIEWADKVGLDAFAIGEHHREEYLDSANAVILAAAAARTKKIRLVSAVTVLSAADPVRVFQQFATLDLISQGRVEIVAGRGSFIDAYSLFGLNLDDYDALFAEKLDLLLKIRDNRTITWSGRFRAALKEQSVFPRPVQQKMPIWLGVGGTPASFERAGRLGLPLMVAVIGGETHRFRPLIDLYREAGVKAGYSTDDLKVGLHSLGYVATNSQEAIETFYPGYKKSFTKIGLERGWGPVTRNHFDWQCGPKGAFLIGNPELVAEKILRHSEALGGISRVTFQMDSAGLTHEQILQSITLLAREVKPLVQ